ncbi:hypothetical protein C1751_26420 [Pseudomonas fluorescens]|nr:hypothetical protein C1751_26420 [Pseudomonas fluorescens]
MGAGLPAMTACQPTSICLTAHILICIPQSIFSSHRLFLFPKGQHPSSTLTQEILPNDRPQSPVDPPRQTSPQRGCARCCAGAA